MNQLIYLMLLPAVLAMKMSIGGLKLSVGPTTPLPPIHTFHSTPATFEEAKSICKQEGASLAVISSLHEEDEMVNIWKKSGLVLNASKGLTSQAFIGIHSLNTKGHWETIDGKTPEYMNWSQDWAGESQPSDPIRQKCGSLLKQGGFDDVECDFRLAFFCKKM
uniref:C-type lectin domain-containing protein n=1 Tax=Bracoviriform kariyai TaxID=199362 RepID=Q80S76_9VIRU|nr:hypothetical protein [Bracoviriform kariyai]